MEKSLKGRRVLIVDDDHQNCELISKALEPTGCELRKAHNGKEAQEVFKGWVPELVLLDQDMPEMTGLQFLRWLRGTDHNTDVVFISASGSTNMIREALDSGADDYVRKPFSFTELLSRIKVRFRIRELVEKLEEANARLKELSEHDDVTSLYNMRSMYDRIDREIKRSKRNKKFVACIMLDMDYFKTVNDNHDHVFGSFVLNKVGEIILDSIRDVDFAARYGGDEFLVVLSDTTEVGARMVAERIRENVESTEFNDGKNSIRLSSSLGYAVGPKNYEFTSKELVRAADRALYDSKETGRNKVSGLNPQDTEKFICALRLKAA